MTIDLKHLDVHGPHPELLLVQEVLGVWGEGNRDGLSHRREIAMLGDHHPRHRLVDPSRQINSEGALGFIHMGVAAHDG